MLPAPPPKRLRLLHDMKSTLLGIRAQEGGEDFVFYAYEKPYTLVGKDVITGTPLEHELPLSQLLLKGWQQLLPPLGPDIQNHHIFKSALQLSRDIHPLPPKPLKKKKPPAKKIQQRGGEALRKACQEKKTWTPR